MSHVRVAQSAKGLAVFGGQVIVHLQGNRVIGLNGAYLSEANIAPKASVDVKGALKEAARHSGLANPELIDEELMIFNPALVGAGPSANYLIYRLSLADSSSDASVTVLVDAHEGKPLLQFSNAPSDRDRVIYDLNNEFEPPGGTQCYGESGPTRTDPTPECASAHTYLGETYDYYRNTHNRDSYDNLGARTRAYVRYGESGAWWFNSGYALFGTGFAVKDVVAHEWTHAVTQYTAGLLYQGQSGALNESMSDVFGAMVDRANWLMGESAPRGPFRSMADPTLYGDPGKGSDYSCLPIDRPHDWGGVHTNSGIPNHAAYLISEGGGYNGHTISGIGRSSAERIYYRALANYLTPGATFLDAYNALLASTADLFGSSSQTYSSVRMALQAAEMDQAVRCGGTGTPDAFEPDDTRAQARLIAVNGDVQSHDFHTGTDQDWVRFDATANTAYTVETLDLGTDSDTVLALYDATNANPIAVDDDGGGSRASRVTWTPTSSGTYYMMVRQYNRSSVGSDTSYRLRVTSSQAPPSGGDTYEPDNSVGQASLLTINGPAQSHTFDVAGDQDWARFSASQGTAYTIETLDLGRRADTILTLYDANGTNLLAENDDGGGNRASRITWTAPASGTYYIKVRHYSATVFGNDTNYDLRAIGSTAPSADGYEPDGSPAEASLLAVNGPAQSHTLHVAGDQDWARFVATQGTAYTIETLNLGARSDTVLALYGIDGSTTLAENDDGGGGLASRITWTAPASGTHYVRVRHFNAARSGADTSYDLHIIGVAAAGDTYEPDNTSSQASPLTVNGPAQTHRFHVAGDQDWAAFYSSEGTAYVIETRNLGSGSDTLLYLYDSVGGYNVLAQDDDSGGGRASRITWIAPYGGLFFVRVRHFNSGRYGADTNYDLRVTGSTPSSGADLYEPDNTLGTAKPITIDATAQTHNFHVAGDEDWVYFSAAAYVPYVMETLSLGSNSDTVLELYTNSARQLAWDDDGGGGRASRLAGYFSVPGTYYLRVRHFNSTRYGTGTNYDLRIRAGASAQSLTSANAVITNKVVHPGEDVEVRVYLQGAADAIKVEADGKAQYLQPTELSPLVPRGYSATADVPADATRWSSAVAGDTVSAWYGAAWHEAELQPVLVMRWRALPEASGKEIPLQVRWQATDSSGRTLLADAVSLSVQVVGQPPKVNSVDPISVVTSSQTVISLVGTDFAPTPKVSLSDGANTIALPDVMFVDATRLQVVVPAGIKPANYKIIVVNPDGGRGEYDNFSVTADVTPTATSTATAAATRTPTPTATPGYRTYLPVAMSRTGGW